MLRKVAICAVIATSLLAVGCGSSEDSTSEEDSQGITELVDRLNDAAREKDASEYCLIMQPSAVEETFHGIDRCVKETEAILEAAGEQPALTIEQVEIDGDVPLGGVVAGVGARGRPVAHPWPPSPSAGVVAARALRSVVDGHGPTVPSPR